jgi:predicted enzyme related to lactoylglutathione lyase
VNFNSILIGSEDPQPLVEYFSKLFGAPGFEDGGYAGWQIGDGYVTVGPHDQVKGPNPQPGRMLWNIETVDVLEEFERLKGAGAIVVQEPYRPDGMDDATQMWIATFADPDGNYFQLMSPM